MANRRATPMSTIVPVNHWVPVTVSPTASQHASGSMAPPAVDRHGT